ncbi:MAG: acyl-CoA dehydrogenase family protein [Lentisphaerota bacterium]
MPEQIRGFGHVKARHLEAARLLTYRATRLLEADADAVMAAAHAKKFATRMAERHLPECMQVFGAEGYFGGQSGPSQLVFEKRASAATTISQEGLLNTTSGAITVNRVRAEVVPVLDGSLRLQCKGFVVRNAGDSFFEDEVAMGKGRSVPYQLMLNQVKKQLN